MMAHYTGVTETFWSNFAEDSKLKWKIFIRAAALLLMVSIIKTGNIYFDTAVALFIGLLSLLVIESQRSYGKYSSKLRKLGIKLSITLGTLSIALLGITLYSQIGIIVGLTVFNSMYSEILSTSSSVIEQFIFVGIFIFATLKATLDRFRESEIEELIFKLPNNALRNLLIRQKFKSKNFISFAIFEFGVILLGYFYASFLFICINGYISILSLSI